MTHYCPHCGANLTKDEPISRDGWELTEWGAKLDGIPVALTKQQVSILHSLASVDRPINVETLAARAGSQSDNPSNVVCVQILRMRRALGKRCPIETVLGRGYRWAA